MKREILTFGTYSCEEALGDPDCQGIYKGVEILNHGNFYDFDSLFMELRNHPLITSFIEEGGMILNDTLETDDSNYLGFLTIELSPQEVEDFFSEILKYLYDKMVSYRSVEVNGYGELA